MESLESISREVIACRKCPRLVAWREQVGVEKRRAYREEMYWAKGVPGFGDPQARVLVLGLAPGAHGSNRTGRMFTGDDSGKFLYPALYRAGFASQPEAYAIVDGLTLTDLWITAVCRCVPPDNKPNAGEIVACRPFLQHEMLALPDLQGIVALGKIAFDCALSLTGRKAGVTRFGHGVLLPRAEEKPWILASYHPSRQNTQTGRLTETMFDQVWAEAAKQLKAS